jgi:hypothetical protein
MEEREPQLIIAVGRKGIGKTHTTKQVINAYIRGNQSKGVKPRRVLIVDANNEFQEYKMISPDDIIKFTIHPTIECRRVVPIYPNGKPFSLNEIQLLLEHCLDNFRGGMLLIEDISKYVGDTVSTDIIGHLCTIRHKDTDVIIHFQGIGKAGNPKIKANMNILRFHKVSEDVERHKNKFQEYTEILKIAEILVNNRHRNGDIRFYCYVDFDHDRILGNFGQDEFVSSVTEYIQDNENDTIGRYLRKKDRQGNKIYNYTEALEHAEKDIFEKYYGNERLKSKK